MTTLDMITPFTLSPSVFGGPVRHLPRFENYEPLTLAALGITLIGHERTIMLAECGEALVPPHDEPDESHDVLICGGCAYIRYSVTDPRPNLGHGVTAPNLPTAAESTDHDRPRLLLVSG